MPSLGLRTAPPGQVATFLLALVFTLQGLRLDPRAFWPSPSRAKKRTYTKNSKALALVLPQPVMQYPSPIAEEQRAVEGAEWPSSSSDGPGSDWMLGRSDDIGFTYHPLVGKVYVVALPGNNLIRQFLVERPRDWKAYGRWRVINIKTDEDDLEVKCWGDPSYLLGAS
jgi:hypothetical protein